MTTFYAPFSAKTLAAAALVALTALAHAGTAPAPTGIITNTGINPPTMKPLPATLTDLKASLSAGTTATSTLSATAVGSAGALCGIAITSTVAFMQPLAFTIGGSFPLQHTSTFQIVNKGNQTVTATPTAGPNFPACGGKPITVTVAVQ